MLQFNLDRSKKIVPEIVIPLCTVPQLWILVYLLYDDKYHQNRLIIGKKETSSPFQNRAIESWT